MTPRRGGNAPGEVVALVGIGGILCLGVLTLLGAALQMPSVAYAGLASLLAVAVVLAIVLHRGRLPGFRFYTVGVVSTTLLALVALIAYLTQNLMLEYSFLVATGVSGLLAILGFRYGVRRAPKPADPVKPR